MVVRQDVRAQAARNLAESARVLVVERDSHVAEMLRANLVAVGYSVSVVTDGLVALRAFDTDRPALVTLELLLSTISGFRLAALFKRSRPEVPVLVVTALAFEEAEEVVHTGINDFLTKPIDPQNLVETIKYHLRPLPHEKDQRGSLPSGTPRTHATLFSCPDALPMSPS